MIAAYEAYGGLAEWKPLENSIRDVSLSSERQRPAKRTNPRCEFRVSFLGDVRGVCREDRARSGIHDTIETFGANLAAVGEQWEKKVRPLLHAKAARLVERAPNKYFGEVDDIIRGAAQIAIGRNLTPEMVRELCAYGY